MEMYETIRLLGSGKFGNVYLAKRLSDNKFIALKIVDVLVESVVESTMQEVKFLSELSIPSCNPFVVCYYGSNYDKKNGKILIEMEYIDGDDMSKFISILDNDDTKYHYLLLIAKDLAKGLEYIHNKNILHNDIKLENIMITTKYVPKLIDFGLSCQTKTSDLYTRYCESYKGTPYYIAPELFTLKVRLPASDMWALGVTLYIGATGSYPIDISTYNVTDLFIKIRDTEPAKLNTSNTVLNEVVNGLLVKDIYKRLTAKQLSEKLKSL